MLSDVAGVNGGCCITGALFVHLALLLIIIIIIFVFDYIFLMFAFKVGDH